MAKMVVTSAFPFVPVDLCLAHFASTYIPADVYARYERCFGNDCVHVSATDVHSIYAAPDGMTTDIERCRQCDESYRRQFAALNIEFDAYFSTDDPQHEKHVDAVLRRLHERGAVYQRPTDVLRCGQCGMYLPKRLASDPEAQVEDGTYRYELEAIVRKGLCAFCKSREISITSTNHWFLKIAEQRELLEVSTSAQAQEDVRATLGAFVRQGVPDWNFSRDNRLGLPLPFDQSGKTLYLWLESLVAYQSLAQKTEVEHATFRHFIGKNLVYYHGIVWPVLLRDGLGYQDPACQISARGFMDIPNTPPELLSIDTLVARYDPDYVRFYICHAVPDRMVDFSVSEEGLAQACNLQLVKKCGNLLRRVWSLLNKAGTMPRRIDRQDPLVRMFYDDTLRRLRERLDRQQVQRAVHEVINYVRDLNRELENPRRRSTVTPEERGLLAFMAASTLVLIEPVAPRLAARSSVFAGWKPCGLRSIETVESCPLSNNAPSWQLVPSDEIPQQESGQIATP